MKKTSLIAIIISSAFLSSLLTAAIFNLINISVPSTPSNQTTLINRIEQLEKNALADQRAILELENKINAQKSKHSNEQKEHLLSLDIKNSEEKNEPSSNTNDIDQLFRERRAQRIASLQPEYKKQRLIDSGLTEQEANLILTNESKIALQNLNSQYKAQRERYEYSLANETQIQTSRERLRESLGDDSYERYLEANNAPTSASVNSVIQNSPGFNAGLQSGDQITHYDGERVFNLRDVNQLTLEGSEGESILIEVIRDGEPVQIALPRGPIGIVGGRGRRP